MVETIAGTIGRQNSGAALDQANAAADTQPRGQLEDQTFEANPADRRPPGMFAKAKKMLSAWREARADKNYVKNQAKQLGKISVQMPNPGDTMQKHGLPSGKKHAAALAQHEVKKDARINEIVAKGTPNDMDAFELSHGNELFISMFGKEDHDIAEPLMVTLLNEAHNPVRLTLYRFVEQGGSFKAVDGVADDHFSYDRKTGVAEISSSVLRNGIAFVNLLDTNLRQTGPGEVLVGKQNIKAHNTMVEARGTQEAIIQNAKPQLEDLPAGPPFMELVHELVHTPEGSLPGVTLNIDEAYKTHPNYAAMTREVAARNNVGAPGEDPPVPSEAELLRPLMFGAELERPSLAVLNRALADPDVKQKLMTFLRDGGTFELVSGREDDVRFAPALNKITITYSKGFTISAAQLETGLRTMFNVPALQPPEAQTEAVVQNPPQANIETATDVPGLDEAAQTGGADAPTEAQPTPADQPEPETLTPQALADLMREDELPMEVELDTLVDMVNDEEGPAKTERDNLTNFGRRMQDYQDAIDRLNNKI